MRLKIFCVTCARLPVFDVPRAGQSDKRTTRKRGRLAESDVRHFTRFSFERKILPERIIRIPFPHQDPAKIRMAGETNTHHVVNFSLVPVCSGPERGDGWDLKMVLRDSGFQAEVDVRVQRVKFIDDLKPRFIAEVIDAREVGEKIEAELLFGKLAGQFDLRERQFESGFAAKIRSPNDLELVG